ncbi:hypothetical protein FKR81_15270 [Lentzea tibetensis]|uniref:Uncharacterized protein n=1 Tax=Lentzea tibetensis TaxID=2591470 RepID=A0A563EV81_9PSEU|nr:hypothetical protein [Lentzea tibetensis]TWP51553.1 hypothetical protein FKR81_15270 [Lentzea tibetensis]
MAIYRAYQIAAAGGLELGEEWVLADDAERVAFVTYLERQYCGDKFASMDVWWQEQRFREWVDYIREWEDQDWFHLYVKSAHTNAGHPGRGGLIRCVPQPGGGYLLDLGERSRAEHRLVLIDDADRLAFVAYLERRYTGTHYATIDEWEEAQHQRYEERRRRYLESKHSADDDSSTAS